ncbi:MAG: fluoride efflux transporter CrcB [Pseudomonadota bacterium]
MGAVAYLYVALGGALGASGRLALSVLLSPSPLGGFPVAVLCANILGCFVMGSLAALMVSKGTDDPLKLFLMPGLLGGFTTFSAFSLEAFALAERGAWSLAALYVGLTVLGTLGAVALGWVLVRGGV